LDTLNNAQAAAGYGGTKRAAADKAAIAFSHSKLVAFECFTPQGLAKLKKGGSPVILQGKFKGNEIALDHVLPVSLVPELAARFYNLEAMPAAANLSKGNRIGRRELDLARSWQGAGLLSAKGLAAVEAAWGK
jgi:hypothetical protein